jgi:biopolymer transport protein ExbB/biopolymer transport protein TolQ
VSILDLVTHMGPLPWLVILLLASMNVVTLTVGIVKWRRLRILQKATTLLAPGFWAALKENRLPDAVTLIQVHRESPLARVLGQALERAAPLLDDPDLAARGIESAERSMMREQIALATELKRHLPVLATIGATAPFVGLLGTTIGITNSFVGIASTGGGGIEAVAGGVGEALVTTAAGLIVAIPALWCYNYFIARLEELFADLAYGADELADWLWLRRARVSLRYDTPAASPDA